MGDLGISWFTPTEYLTGILSKGGGDRHRDRQTGRESQSPHSVSWLQGRNDAPSPGLPQIDDGDPELSGSSNLFAAALERPETHNAQEKTAKCFIKGVHIRL